MELFIFIIWLILLFIIPLALIVTSYCKYINGGQPFDIVLTLTLGFFIHIIISAFTIPFMFIMIYAGAHSDPVGNGLRLEGKFIYAIGLLIYGGVGWLLCSLIYGKLIKPKFSRKDERSQQLKLE